MRGKDDLWKDGLLIDMWNFLLKKKNVGSVTKNKQEGFIRAMKAQK